MGSRIASSSRSGSCRREPTPPGTRSYPPTATSPKASSGSPSAEVSKGGGPMIKGFATAAGTSEYRARLGRAAADLHWRTWDGLLVSSLGAGTYLGGDDEATDLAYRESVARALALGLNLVDSAINYRH